MATFSLRFRPALLLGATLLALAPAYPNPFTHTTTLRFAVPAAGQVRLVIYDLLGRELAVLIDGELPAATHAVAFEGAGLPGGTYFTRLTTGSGFEQVQRLTLLR